MHPSGNAPRRERSKALWAATMLLCPILLQGQSSSGQLHLEIKDPAGLATEATGKLENLANGTDRSFKTDPQGVYTFSDLPAAHYRLEVRKVGFATQSLSIDVSSGTATSRTVTLVLAAQASQVEVIAPTPLPGTDLPLDEIPAPVQTLTSR